MELNLMLDYLSSLESNNSREWFHANKEQYLAANKEFEELVEVLMEQLRQYDPAVPFVRPGDLTFKLQRDTRFSHDKSPYNPCFRAHIGARGKLPVPVGYYIMIRPGNCSFLGGGLFADMFRDATTMVRDHIVKNGSRWEEIITAPDFKEYFTVGGTVLKKVPPGYDASHPQAEYLKNKSWYLEYPISDKQLKAEDFVCSACEVFRRMQPFHSYLNQALCDFRMPER